MPVAVTCSPGPVQMFLVEALAHIILRHIVIDRLSSHLGLDDSLAFITLMQQAFGADGIAGDGDFLARSVQREQA